MTMEYDQEDVIEFLKHGKAYGQDVHKVKLIETHISCVFVTAQYVYKLKRAVRYPYLDFSTLEKRKYFCEQEIKINKRTAPDLYLGVAAVVRHGDGFMIVDSAEIDENDAVQDYLVKMRPFDEATLFHHQIKAGTINRALIENLSKIIADFHQQAMSCDVNGASITKDIVENNRLCFNGLNLGRDVRDRVLRTLDLTDKEVLRVESGLVERGLNGYVRRCHGDLHLRNICIYKNQPTLFDAIEFNDGFSIIDVFYDLAFLLMDLDFSGQRRLANICLNSYMDQTGDWGGLTVLPLFLSMRAAIRCHVNYTIIHNQHDQSPDDLLQLKKDASGYLDNAFDYLQNSPPRLIAVGGLSGSGKSRLARELAPFVGTPPGARVIRSDVMRKILSGVSLHKKLSRDGYTVRMTEKTYQACFDATEQTLKTDRSVVFDAVFGKPEERKLVERLASDLNIPFTGLWLDAPLEIRQQRARDRINNVSDAGAQVLKKQMMMDTGIIDWFQIDSSQSRSGTLKAGAKAAGVDLEPDLNSGLDSGPLTSFKF